MPFPVALALVLLVILGVFVTVPLMVGNSLRQVLGALPELQAQLSAFERNLTHRLQEWGLAASSDDQTRVFGSASQRQHHVPLVVTVVTV